MRLVVDASVAVKWLLREEEDSEIADLLRTGDYELHAPALLRFEVSNALWRRTRRNGIGRDRAERLAAEIARMPIAWNEDATLAEDAFPLALSLGHPIYDCVYLALARRLGARLATADVRFARAAAAGGYGGDIAVLSEWAGERP